ncbi:MAG: HAD-IA family hydrolase [Akkermansiaceae bacterium]|nr:HAD-IA family hydrolase [Akkermansiaceae bacterium]
MPLETVISDLDGTILETEDYHRRAYNALFEELGLAQRWSKRDYSDRLAQVGGEKFREVFKWLRKPEDEFADTRKRLYARKTELYVSLIVADLEAGRLPLRPGVARLFAELREGGIPVAIASTCVKWAAIEVIRAALGEEFLGSLATICAGDDVSRKKPHPDIYLLAAKQCGMLPANCVVLEDTAHGLRAALDAGMKCVVTPSELALEDDFTGADLLVESLEVPERIDVEALRRLVTS